MRRLGYATLLLLASAACAWAQASGPFKIGYILDMSGPYADITGIGSVMAARMAVEDFGGKVLGRSIEVIYADHLEQGGHRRRDRAGVVRQPGRRGHSRRRRLRDGARRQ